MLGANPRLEGLRANISSGDIIPAELWALHHGLKMAWDKKNFNLLVEVDSAIILRLILGSVSTTHPFIGLAIECICLSRGGFYCFMSVP